jgi:hypothetical protein
MTTPRAASAAERRAEALREAASGKHAAATARADAAIRQLVKEQQEITFRSVARTGPVSIDFLYGHPDLRPRIEKLRSQQRTTTTRPVTQASSTDSGIVHALTARLRDEHGRHVGVVADLERKLAAAHGELLRLRRLLDQHGVAHELR